MISTDVSCSIRCNARARQRMYDLPDAFGAIQVRADKFACVRCHQTWDWKDFAGFNQLDKVSCSNCYSKAVIITRVHIEIPSAAELAGKDEITGRKK